MEHDNKMVTVGDSVARELNYYYKAILDSISVSENTTPKLSWVCCDNEVNQEDSRGDAHCCKYCQRKGQNETTADNLDHIISSASLYGLCISTGSLVGSQLSTTCPRLQKHGESLASLTYGSYLDVTHSIINPEAMELIEQQKKAREGPVSKEGRSKMKEFERKKVDDGTDDEEYIEDFHPCVGEMMIEETAIKENGGHPLLVPYATNNHISVLSHLALSGGSIHTRGMKFKSDRNLKNTKSDIPLISSRVECKCAEAAQEVFRQKSNRRT